MAFPAVSVKEQADVQLWVSLPLRSSVCFHSKQRVRFCSLATELFVCLFLPSFYLLWQKTCPPLWCFWGAQHCRQTLMSCLTIYLIGIITVIVQNSHSKCDPCSQPPCWSTTVPSLASWRQPSYCLLLFFSLHSSSLLFIFCLGSPTSTNGIVCEWKITYTTELVSSHSVSILWSLGGL